MPFAPINVKEEIERQRNISPEFRKAWDESRAEYKLVGEMISLRKQEIDRCCFFKCAKNNYCFQIRTALRKKQENTRKNLKFPVDNPIF